jgi:membrane protease YdiL (CAAX protease family)
VPVSSRGPVASSQPTQPVSGQSSRALLVVLTLLVGLAVASPHRGVLMVGVGLAFACLLLLTRTQHETPFLWSMAAVLLLIALSVPWPLPAAPPAALLAYTAIRRSRRPHVRPLVLGLAVGLPSAPMALAVTQLWRPEETTHTFFPLPKPSPLVLLSAILMLALANSSIEESLWRGTLQVALEKSGIPPIAAILVQAASFGIGHWHGLPGGLTGILGATLFGALLGSLRRQTRSLTACIVAHAVVDVALFAEASRNLVFLG